MAEQQLPAVIPSLVVSDVEATLAWFEQLGFERSFEMVGSDGAIVHAEVRRGPEVSFMIGPPMMGTTPGSTGMSVYVNLRESVDAYHDQVRAAGIEPSRALQDEFWGDRTFTVQHPDGYTIMFSEHVRDVSEDEMARAMAEMSDQMAGTTA